MPANKLFILLFTLLFFPSFRPTSHPPTTHRLEIVFEPENHRFSSLERQIARNIIINASQKVRSLLSTLPKKIKVSLSVTNENLEEIGGVNGVALSNAPAEVAIVVSRKYPGGIQAAMQKSLSVIIFHEFHHLSRGWVYHDNAFEASILNASINEGLAIIFAEKYTGVKLARFDCPKEVNQWSKEIQSLSKQANFDHWMFEHPDGRSAIGYKVGKYLVQEAMKYSGENIVEISKHTPKEILQMASPIPLMGFRSPYPRSLPANHDKSLPFVENSTKLRYTPHP
ncbi:hypothetical protein BKI52_13260 [marine bacterium AO1-C]|nr:hypothetical protein BKI52_13260 [marine bacterium AO1-C]